MKITKLEFLSKRIVNYLIYAILILPAIFFNPWQYNSFILPKTFIFLTLVLWLIIFYIFLRLERVGKREIDRSQKIIVSLAFLLIIFEFISLVFSPNKDISFWGSYYRQDGLIVHIFLVLFFIILLKTVDSKEQFKKYLLSLTFLSGIISLFGILQKIGISFGFNWEKIAFVRVPSTLGNPLYLSIFLVFTIFYSIYNLKLFKNFYIRIAIIFSLILQLMALVFTSASSSTLSILSAIFFVLFFYFWKKNKKVSLLVLSVVLVGLVLLVLISTGIVGNQTMQNIFSDFSMSNSSNLQRLYVWQSSWNAFLLKPWFGWGNDLFSEAYNFTKNTNLIYPLELDFDRAHNIFLDYLVMEGVFVFLIYVFIFVYSIIIGLKRFFREKDALYLVASSLIFAFLVNFSFSIPTITSYILLFFTLSIVFYRKAAGEQDLRVKNTYRKKYLPVYIILLIASIILSYVFFRPLLADVLFQKALNTPEAGARVNHLDRAIEKWPFKKYKMELFMTENFIIENSKNEDQIKKYAIRAKGLEEDLLKNYSNFYLIQLAVARFNRFFLDQENDMDVYFNKAHELAPNRYHVFWVWGDTYFEMGNKRQAILKYEKAIEIDPSQPYPYFRLSELYERMGDEWKYQEYLDLAKEHGWNK